MSDNLPTEERILREAPKPQANYREVFAQTERAPMVITDRGWLLLEILTGAALVALVVMAAWMLP